MPPTQMSTTGLEEHRFGVLNIFEREPCAELLATYGAWEDVEFEVALDSGSTEHVCSRTDIPGYCILESAGSRVGQCFIVGNGARLPNEGEAELNLTSSDNPTGAMKSTFQVANVTRPLISVGKLTDAGLNIIFSKTEAKVTDTSGKTIMTFVRNPGGLYVTKLMLRQPVQPFVRPS